MAPNIFRYYHDMVPPKTLQRVVVDAETLKASLRKRYEQRAHSKAMQADTTPQLETKMNGMGLGANKKLKPEPKEQVSLFPPVQPYLFQVNTNIPESKC